jgi:hypothetical protein
MTPIIILKEIYLTQSLGYATQSTIQRYLSQANHPIGGVRASPLSRPDTVVKILRAKTQVLHIFFTVLHKHSLLLLELTKHDAHFPFH